MSNETIQDTTLRSVLFGKQQLRMIKDPNGQMILEEQVDKSLFDKQEHILKVLAQTMRVVQCDSGILRHVIMSPAFGTNDNKKFNDAITFFDDKYNKLRRMPSTYKNSIEGRPMQSYVIEESQGNSELLGTQISSPSDFTCLFLKGSVVSEKCDFFKPTDIIMVFKGSSTSKNFKHDLQSQFTPTELNKLFPTIPTTGQSKIVPSSFVKPIVKNWSIIKQKLDEYKPTRLFCVGHSLGGALASLFTFVLAELRQNFPYIQSVHNVTQGAPTILGDGARNVFNSYLDSGFVTLDRIVAVGKFSRVVDIIPSIPVGFSHPGFQPLRTELYPEKRTGRAYNFDIIRKVYQTGGVFGLGKEKSLQEKQTKTHMPNKIIVNSEQLLTQTFPHAEYLDMTFFNAFRLPGMKNPGLKTKDGKQYTFVANLYTDGVKFSYVLTKDDTVAAEPTESENILSMKTNQIKDSKVGGTRKQKRNHMTKRMNPKNKRTTKKHKY